MLVRRLRALAAASVIAALVLVTADPAGAAPEPRRELSTVTFQALRDAVGALRTETPEPSFPPGRFTPAEPEWDGESGVADAGDPRLRALVVDIADLAEDAEVRDAAEAALAAGTAQAIEEFLVSGEDAAKAKAAARKSKTAKDNKAKITAMAGTGGPIFNAEVQRVLKGTDYDRESFLIYGADLARARDEKVTADAKTRADQLRARVQVLAGLPDSEVARAAQAALAAGDAAITEFLNTGYAAAAKKDAEAREQYLKDQREKEEAAEELSELAKKAARASTARRNLLVAHGDGVRALQRSSNALTSAATEARKAEQILAANTAGNNHPADAYNAVKAEVARQVGYAEQATLSAKQAAARATTEANILVETGLTYGVEWGVIAQGMAEAAEAAQGAATTARHAIDATAATGAARNAEEKAKAHAEKATKWRLYAQEHAKAAAALAKAAKKQADAAKEAAARTKAARADAEAAEARAWAAAKRTRDQRIIAENEAAKAAAARARAEQERAIAASARARAEQQAAVARSARGQATHLAGVARTARQRAEAHELLSSEALGRAQTAESNAASARQRAEAADRESRTADAKAAAMEAWAAQQAGGQDAAAARDAASQARGEASTARGAATGARSAANTATGAAASARSAANEATAAAARARAAAQEAEAAAARANVAASNAEREAATTHNEAMRSNAAAAEATAQQAKAAEAARTAVRLAEEAAQEAALAFRAAGRTKAESDAAAAEAVSAATQAAASVRASDAARRTAAGIAEPANTAIALVAPFTSNDLSVDFVIEVAEQAQKVGEEQAQAAETRAAEAVAAAQSAAAAAERANDQVKPAYQAAAAAAQSAADAARSAADAQKAAAAAAVDGAAARAAGARANQADAQARQDAILARQAANAANNDAAIAGRAASAAENDAAAARGAASAAEADAVAARNAASAAEADAAKAETAATNAKKNADAATEAAKNALAHAIEAQKAYERAEARQREADRKAREEAANGKGGSDLSPVEEELLCGEDPACVEEYRNNLSAADKGVLDFLKENGADILIGLIGLDDIKACFTEGDVEACLWTFIGFVPFGKLAGVLKAFAKLVPKVGKFIEALGDAKKWLKEAGKKLDACKINLDDIVDGAGGGGSAAFGAGGGGAGTPANPNCPYAALEEITKNRKVVDAVRNVVAGTGQKRMRPDGSQQEVYRADEKTGKVRTKWRCSFEFEVPGTAGNDFRLLVNRWGDVGWTNKHYGNIQPTGIKVPASELANLMAALPRPLPPASERDPANC